MKLPSLVKIPKHKRFEFRPRHYDPIKEEIEERVQKIKIKYEKEGKEAPYSTNIKFDRINKRNKFEISLQLYLVIFMLFDLFLLLKTDNLSNQTWLIILITEVTAIYLKIRFNRKKEL